MNDMQQLGWSAYSRVAENGGTRVAVLAAVEAVIAESERREAAAAADLAGARTEIDRLRRILHRQRPSDPSGELPMLLSVHPAS
jgi:hypothetical protein